jgi:hypothetical protein
VQRAILKYLIERPLAKDTAEGIVQWWLPDFLPSPPEIAVQRALDALVQQGWVVVTKKSPTMTLYGLKESRREEILEFLND